MSTIEEGIEESLPSFRPIPKADEKNAAMRYEKGLLIDAVQYG